MSKAGWKRVLGAAVVVGSAVACAGGPGVNGPAAAALFEDYSGTWVLDTATSQRVPEPGRAMRGRGRGGGAGGGRDPFGGGRGGDPFGGGGFGRPGGDGPPPGGRGGFGGQDPQAMRTMMTLARTRPQRIELELTDSLFVIAETPGRRLELPMKGDEVQWDLAGWPVEAKVEWDDRKPSVKRKPKDGGDVVDHYELVTPDRLLVTREFKTPMGGKVEARFVYDRQKPE